jgi:hypothetical protein
VNRFRLCLTPFVPLIFVAVLICPLASAATIISGTGPSDTSNFIGCVPFFGPTCQPTALAASWSSTQSYQNLNIGFYSSGGGPIHAYLTNHIGTSTTVGNVLQSANPSSTPAGLMTLFTGLSLGPGTYYLVLTSTDVTSGNLGLWTGSNNATVVTGSGISNLTYYRASNTTDYTGPFASGAQNGPNAGLDYLITGDVATGVPEPSSLGIVFCAGVALAMTRRLKAK